MYANPLEFLAKRFQNVVKYDADGNPSIFVKFPKMKSSELDGSLPAHVHPAFIVNGVEQDYILIGKYKGAELTKGGTVYSLPNLPPVHGVTYDDALARMRAAGDGVSGLTIADHGFLLLLAQKNGWNPSGFAELAYYVWNATKHKYYQQGNDYTYGGRRYTCLKSYYGGEMWEPNHRPDTSPTYWKLSENHPNGMAYGTPWPVYEEPGWPRENNVMLMLNGTGPKEWYLGGDVSGVADIAGNVREYAYGYRMINGELQIMKDNDAADPATDMGVDSAAWKAILPHSGDDGYDLVAPGTEGTLHWEYTSSAGNVKLALRAGAPSAYTRNGRRATFRDLIADDTLSGGVPYIVRELGIFPTEGSTMPGDVTVKTRYDNMEYVGRRTSCFDEMEAHISTMDLMYGRTHAAESGHSFSTGIGCRPRAME